MATTLHKPANPVRFVTASSLFDGHDAAINIMRRILQSQGAEVIHLGHNRSVSEVVDAAIQEDAQGIAISAYQGGHVEYFSYLVELLNERGAGHIRVYGGGGGVIVPEEIELLHSRGVARIFSPQDGQTLGLARMINLMIEECDHALTEPYSHDALLTGADEALARAITHIEAGTAEPLETTRKVPVLGITGTGGSGKSSLTDELVRRFRLDQQDKLRIAVLAVDPTRRRGGGALLGDRIRMNCLDGDRVFFRSMATRRAGSEIPDGLEQAIVACKASGADLVIVETPGIGQGDAAIVPFVDFSLYVMTPEFGAASQLEKIDMLDYADAVAINKFERRGAEDARRDVARQMVRNREAFGVKWEDMPVYGTSAATFNDDGVTALYQFLRDGLVEHGLHAEEGALAAVAGKTSTSASTVVPASRVRYLSDISDTVRGYHRRTDEQVEAVRRHLQLSGAQKALEAAGKGVADIAELATEAERKVDRETANLLGAWPATVEQYSGDELVFKVRDKEIHTRLTRETLSGNQVRRVSLPRYDDEGSLLRFLRKENLPGFFPYTAGVFPFKREGEDPARMFAGEGDAFRTNRRFKYLSKGNPATRLSTAFDSVTLYGRDPDTPPDVYGKIGTSGVSIASLDDMKALYDGFDLVAPTTSVSMTINGPAPTILAYFLNTVIDQQVAVFTEKEGREPSAEEYTKIRAFALANVRGTVQADILKEDQGQNTCIFSTEFSLRMMADIQEWFIQQQIRNFYSVSISGYHIAEAGANPISQLAFTLANGFTYVESYLARGMNIDDFAPNLSFFFSNGMDAEYSVIGRVARRIWAVAMRDRYGAAERSQKFKYHVQTSGRSLHAQEMDFNDIRTTLQALCALYDNCNSLHTNAYDEAITTPTESSVRRAMAIQMIINKEWGLSANENPLQGSFVIDELTDLVEEAVLMEFDRISERGGVLGAMETGYQRGRIQDESMLYEQRKHDGSLPLIGVNTFLPEDGTREVVKIELARATEEEKESQVERTRAYQAAHRDEAQKALARLREVAQTNENVFAVLMDAARVCTLGQITEAFFEVGGQYRRNI
ncbi:methylmalonyl-CoA mutase [Lentzea albidocapillata subsp. violacea]|uniref:Fused isobutyryl-CoA mutase n=1 Tax=Lentzea albidocapillata subsp. violacea TaxID=128104 RepID=A0A1G9PJM7_9PSEU|nr:fused isobutyryl-CoA mutase/GTPase IcmF [Lentzea albidocapillata]SDL98325.1 methylmalonyl-CoA mutase [Lentzea albidocapillata subsp. violacea]